MIKKFLNSLLLIVYGLLLVLAPAPFVKANDPNTVNLYFFRGQGCPHCADEEKFLEGMKSKYPELQVKDYEVWYNKDNQKILEKVAEKLNKNVSGVPFTVIADQSFIGFSEERTAPLIESAIAESVKNPKPDVLADLISKPEKKAEESSENSLPTASSNDLVKVPFWGNISASSLSLPVLTLVVGFLDGFNPCAMWILLFLISMLIGMKNKRRMWVLGSAFIFFSALSYFVFMAAWLNLILFIGVVLWVRLVIGLLALAGGGYNIKEYFASKKKGGCSVADDRKREQMFSKVTKVVHQKAFWLALIGIAAVAFSVNLFELLCSAGLPAVYTQVLAMNNLPHWQYYLYLILYVFIFMLDDLIIFVIAMVTLQMTGITTKYQKYNHIIGGILMLLIGTLLILRPEWLMFGK